MFNLREKDRHRRRLRRRLAADGAKTKTCQLSGVRSTLHAHATTLNRHTKSEGPHLVGIGGGPDRPNGIWALVPVNCEIWMKADGSERLIESRGGPIWFGPADIVSEVVPTIP
jgi:hypothetical protein